MPTVSNSRLRVIERVYEFIKFSISPIRVGKDDFEKLFQLKNLQVQVKIN